MRQNSARAPFTGSERLLPNDERAGTYLVETRLGMSFIWHQVRNTPALLTLP